VFYRLHAIQHAQQNRTANNSKTHMFHNYTLCIKKPPRSPSASNKLLEQFVVIRETNYKLMI